MYPSTNNLRNTTSTNFSFTANNPFPPDNNNNNNTTIYDNSTSTNFSSFHPIHSPYSFYEEDLQHFQEYFLHQEEEEEETTHVMTSMDNRMEKHTDEDPVVNIGGPGILLCNNKSTSKQIPRKRTSKKDRHSKINTAHGPRDRRMRLSLDVAHKFFGLQDILGFDKASKTVHWLLTKSKTAIKQLINSTSSGGNNNNVVSNTASVSSTSNNSECEVLSGIINDDSSLSLPQEVTTTEKVKTREKRPATFKASRAYSSLAKETREKARARARERTMEKRIRLGNGNNCNNNQVKKIPCIEGMDRSLRSWSPFEGSGGEESTTRVHVLNNHPSNLFNPPVAWSASPFSNYHHNAGITHENQFAEFPCFGNPWDQQTYNN